MHLRHPVIHPVLFAAFFILFLYSSNFFETGLRDVAPVLFGGMGVAALSWFAIKMAAGSAKSALITSVLVVLFFSYGHLHILASGEELLWFQSIKHSHFVIPFVATLGIATFLIVRSRRNLENATRIANIMAVSMVATTIFSIGMIASGTLLAGGHEPGQALPADAGTRPDIYYMILDEYASKETLERVYGFDNSEFLGSLKERGFVIPAESFSNYHRTWLSLTSSLNMDYLGFLEHGSFDESRYKAGRTINENTAMNVARGAGYTVINFENPWWFSNLLIADSHMCLNTVSEFLGAVIRYSALYPMHEILLEKDYRENITCIFEALPTVSQSADGPVFAFAHILSPHAPYVFGPMGEPVDAESLALDGGGSIKGYTDQILHANLRTLETVDRIIADDPTSIIIIQSDHGTWYGIDHEDLRDGDEMRQAFGILNAYYLPGWDGAPIYDSVSPVNTFRIIFNHYLGTDYEILEDRQIYYQETGSVRDVTDIVR